MPILFCSAVGKLSLYSGVLALGVGDTMAAVAGSLMGKTKWPGMYHNHGPTCDMCCSVHARYVCHFYRYEEDCGGIDDVSTYSITGCHGDCNYR